MVMATEGSIFPVGYDGPYSGEVKDAGKVTELKITHPGGHLHGSGEHDDKQEPAKRSDAGKIRYDLIPEDSLHELARVYTVGAKKYSDRNWEKGMSWSRCFGSMMRHAWKFWRGERYDNGPGGTGCHHMAMVAWNAMALCSYDFRQIGNDDRQKISKNNEAFRE